MPLLRFSSQKRGGDSSKAKDQYRQVVKVKRVCGLGSAEEWGKDDGGVGRVRVDDEREIVKGDLFLRVGRAL